MIPGLVSTIIPVFNREDFLEAAVLSVLGQTHPSKEVIVVDDGSTDATARIAARLAQEHPGTVTWVSQQNAGPGAARNRGLQLARGEYIQYLDSDDLLEPTKFEHQVRALQAAPEAGVAYGLTRRVDLVTGKSRVWARTGEAITDIFPSFLMKRGWDTNSPLWRRSVCTAVGPWADFRCLEDWEHDLRAGLMGVLAVRVSEHVCTVRDHAGDRASGMSSGFTPELTRDMFRAHRSVWSKMGQASRTDGPYMEEFSRKVFWIARLCGERGLVDEADEALRMARSMQGSRPIPADLRWFDTLVRLVGWKRAVGLSERIRRLRAA